jgi:hypothetical protein
MRLFHLRKTGAIVQIVLLLMMQAVTVAPGLARSLQLHKTIAHCTGDHVQCGCAPARVASRTCCCFQNQRAQQAARPAIPSCCKKTGSIALPSSLAAQPAPESTQLVADDTEHENALDRTAQIISSLPCGSDERIITAASDGLKFIRPNQLRFVAAAPLPQSYSARQIVLLSRPLEPPDQPPKITFPV